MNRDERAKDKAREREERKNRPGAHDDGFSSIVPGVQPVVEDDGPPPRRT